MTLSQRWFGLAAVAAMTPLSGLAQQTDPKFGAATTAVVIDVVVRDAKGRPVTDLTRADFELLEDGVPQDLGDVTRVGIPLTAPRAAAAGTAPAASPTHSASPRSVAAPTFLALVFDWLTPDARALAYKGALASLQTIQANDFVGVFVSDLSLVPIQTYTTDRAQLRKAIDEAATRATSVFDRDAIKSPTELISQSGGDPHPSVPVVASAESAGRRRPRVQGGSGRQWATIAGRIGL